MKKIRFGAIFLLLVLTACQSASSASQVTTAPSGVGLCANPYIPAVEGATWSSNFHAGQSDYTQVDTITDVGSDAFLVETTAAGVSYVITWTCTPEGLLWLQTDGGSFSAVFPDQQWSTNSYSGLSIPKEIQAGDSWSSSESLTATDSSGSRTFNINLNFQAVGIETVTVPAGTFNAMRIEITMQMVSDAFDVTSDISDWFAEGVGLVKTVAQTDDGVPTYSGELVSFSIP